MTGRLGEEFRPMVDRAALGVGRAVDQPGDAGMGDGAGAHGARFQCGIEPEIRQSIIADGRPRGAQSPDFGVGTRIVKADRGILSYGNDGFT